MSSHRGDSYRRHSRPHYESSGRDDGRMYDERRSDDSRRGSSPYRDSRRNDYNHDYEPHQRDGRSSHRRYDRDDEYRDHSRRRNRSWGRSRSRDRSRDRSRSRSRGGHRNSPYGYPSKDVIMEGLPAAMTEDDVSRFMKGLNVQVDDVRIIRDRKTGSSRQFGYLRFESLAGSRRFLDDFGPSMTIGDATLRLAYAKERDGTEMPVLKDGDWICQECSAVNYARRIECFRCRVERPEAPPPIVNVGDSDVSADATPSQFLLFRGLDSGVSEEVLAKGVAKLFRDPEQDIEKRTGSKPAQTYIGAAEESLLRVLLVRDRFSNDSWKFGFAEFTDPMEAQAAVAKYDSLPAYTISSKEIMISFIHPGVFVPVFDGSADFTFAATTNPSLRLRYWDDGAYVSELVLHTVEPVAETATPNKPKTKKRKAESDASQPKRSVPAHLQAWHERHAELHGVKERPADGQEVNEIQARSRSFADLSTNCCLLCTRQFKSEAEVHKHERLSKLHQDNLKNEALCSRAMKILEKVSEKAYRDRARERRTAFQQPKRPAQEAPQSQSTEQQSPAPQVSKGAAMLGKMGWSAGQGLGARGEGTAEALSQDAYVAGVGLGAEGGKMGDASTVADRNTTGSYKDFVEMAKNKARERFDRM